MKKQVLALMAFVAIVVGSTSAHAREELHSDKIWHFVSGAGIHAALQDGVGASPTTAFLGTSAVAVAKELYDRSQGHGARFDPYDALATIAGSLAYIGGRELIRINFTPRPGGGMVKITGKF